MNVALIFMLLGSLVLLAQLTLLVAGKLLRDRREAAARRIQAIFDDAIVALVAADADADARRAFRALLPPDPLSRYEIAALTLAYLARVRGVVRDGVRALFEEAGFVTHYRLLLASDREEDRLLATAALGQLGAVETYFEIASMLRDPALAVRLQALNALGDLGHAPAAVPILRAFATHEVPRGPSALSLLRLGAEAAPYLIDQLTHPIPAVRSLVAEVIGHLEWAVAAHHLVALLRDEEDEVRLHAARALERLGVDDVALELVAALSDPVPAVRAAVVAALGRTGVPLVPYALRRALADPDPEVARAAAAALASAGAVGMNALIEACVSTVGPFGSVAARDQFDRLAVAGRMPVASEPLSAEAV